MHSDAAKYSISLMRLSAKNVHNRRDKIERWDIHIEERADAEYRVKMPAWSTVSFAACEGTDAIRNKQETPTYRLPRGWSRRGGLYRGHPFRRNRSTG